MQWQHLAHKSYKHNNHEPFQDSRCAIISSVLAVFKNSISNFQLLVSTDKQVVRRRRRRRKVDMDPQLSCKKSLTPPYQQSFRIDDLLTRKAIEQQPDHFSHHTPLQPPPSGPGMCGGRLEKSSSADFHVNNNIGNGIICHDNGKVYYFLFCLLSNYLFFPLILCKLCKCLSTI